MNRSLRPWFVLSVLLLAILPLGAQQGLFSHKDDKPKFSTPLPYEIIHLTNATEQASANEIVTAVRHVIDSDGVTLLGTQNDLLVVGSPEQLTAATTLVKLLDQPRPLHPLYHLSFTVTETDGPRRSVRLYSLYGIAGQETHLKSTRWIPLTPPPAPRVLAKATDTAAASQDNYVPPKTEHIETGINFRVTLDEYTGGVRMQSTISDNSVVAEPPPPGTTNPIIEQNDLVTESVLYWGKSVVLGVIEPPGTTRHIEIAVVADHQQP